MGRGSGARNPKERLTKKRESESYKKELCEIMIDRKISADESERRNSRAGSVASR
jgi:hypothetical protein